MTILLAPFGCFALDLATICTSEDAHPIKELRFVATCWAGPGFFSSERSAG